MGYEAQEGVLPVVLDVLKASAKSTDGTDPVEAPFLRCVAQFGCPGHGRERDE